jgi:predicted ABC-type ATPase
VRKEYSHPLGKGFFQQSAVLDPDAIAVELQAESNTELSSIEAGKEVIRSAETFLTGRISFSVETTLSGGTYLRMLARAHELGYKTRLFYIGTESVHINIVRIRARVLKGGHDVPVEDQLDAILEASRILSLQSRSRTRVSCS